MLAKNHLAALMAAALAPVLAACASAAYVSPVEVTRFSAAPVQYSGRIVVLAAPGMAQDDSLRLAIYQRAVAEELARLGYTVTTLEEGAQSAQVGIETSIDAVGRGDSPVDVGVGGSTGSYGSGVGIGIGIDLGGGGPSEVLYRQLRVVIRPAGGGTAIWEGRAHFSTSPDSEFADEEAAAQRLAEALFSGFPGRSGETIEVE